MNLETLRRLAQNPHYKLTSKQKAELAQHEQKAAVTVFGGVNLHDNSVSIHDTNQHKEVVMKRGKNG